MNSGKVMVRWYSHTGLWCQRGGTASVRWSPAGRTHRRWAGDAGSVAAPWHRCPPRSSSPSGAPREERKTPVGELGGKKLCDLMFIHPPLNQHYWSVQIPSSSAIGIMRRNCGGEKRYRAMDCMIYVHIFFKRHPTGETWPVLWCILCRHIHLYSHFKDCRDENTKAEPNATRKLFLLTVQAGIVKVLTYFRNDFPLFLHLKNSLSHGFLYPCARLLSSDGIVKPQSFQAFMTRFLGMAESSDVKYCRENVAEGQDFVIPFFVWPSLAVLCTRGMSWEVSKERPSPSLHSYTLLS